MDFTRLSSLNEAEIVGELESINLKKPKSWYIFYLLLKEIEERRLYEPEYSSLKPWLNRYCVNHGLSLDRVYSFKRAGKLLESYLNHHDLNYTDLKRSPAPQTIINIEKSALLKFDPLTAEYIDFLDRHIEKAALGELSRDKSYKLYKQIKLESEGRLSESLMKQAVLDHFEWLSKKEINPSNYIKRQTPLRDLYKGIPDFRLEKEQIVADIALFENLTPEDPNDVYTHLINVEGKIESETIAKILAFKDYFDYAWVVLPESAVNEIEAIPKYIGILSYKEQFADQISFTPRTGQYQNPRVPGTLQMVRRAQRNGLADTSLTFKQYPLHVR